MPETLKLAVAITGINNFSTAFSQASKGLTGMSALTTGLSAGLAAVGPVAAVAAAGMAANFIKSSISIAIEYEKNMLKVQAVTGATQEEFASLNAQAQDLGATTEFTARQAAEAMASFGMAGFEVNEILEATPIALDLATAGATEMSVAAGVLANAIRAYGLEASDAMRVGDVLTKTFTSSFTTIESLGQSFKLAAPMAASAGISFEATAAAIGKLGDAGLIGTMAGTGLRQALTKLLTPSGEATETMARLGLQLQTYTVAGRAMRRELDAEIPLFDALNAEQLGLKTTSRDLGMSLAEIGIATSSNNIEISTHKSAIETIKLGYIDWQDSINALKGDLLGLQDVMAGFSLSMKKNNLEIMEIRQQADREGRELTVKEEARITEIQEANDELAISREKASIKQIELQAKIAKEEKAKDAALKTAISSEVATIDKLNIANSSLASQQAELHLASQQTALASQFVSVELENQKAVVDGLTEAIATQVTGTVDFVEMLTQLQEAGATTSDIVKIFSTRGGTAMLALQTQGVESLQALQTELENSQGTLDETTEIMRSGMSQQLKLLESAWEGLKIELGTAFFPVLIKLIPMLIQVIDILKLTWPVYEPLIKAVKDFATEVDKLLGPLGISNEFIAKWIVIGPIAVAIMWHLTTVLKAATWVLKTFGPIFVGMVEAMEPWISGMKTDLAFIYENVLLPIADVLRDIKKGVESTASAINDALTPSFNTLQNVLKPLYDNVIKPLIEKLQWLLDNAAALSESIESFVEGGVIKGTVTAIGGGIPEFQTGTGLMGLPYTGLFKGEKEEIILNPVQSEGFRQIAREGGFAGGAGATGGAKSPVILQGDINIAVEGNTAEEGAEFAKGFVDELVTLSMMGDEEAV